MSNRVPLAERMRPQKLSEVVGQDEIIGDGKILTEIVRRQEPVNIIFWETSRKSSNMPNKTGT